jgi:hypothetical protein
LIFETTENDKFGRSNPFTKTNPFDPNNFSLISLRVALSAVAVNPAIVESGKKFLIQIISRNLF